MLKMCIGSHKLVRHMTVRMVNSASGLRVMLPHSLIMQSWPSFLTKALSRGQNRNHVYCDIKSTKLLMKSVTAEEFKPM